jgi:hypothetical protein
VAKKGRWGGGFGGDPDQQALLSLRYEIFIAQYPNRIELLESNSHVHFRTTPKGKNIVASVQAWFRNLEREMAETARGCASSHAGRVFGQT